MLVLTGVCDAAGCFETRFSEAKPGAATSSVNSPVRKLFRNAGLKPNILKPNMKKPQLGLPATVSRHHFEAVCGQT